MCRRPAILDDIKADSTILVYIRVVTFASESNARRLVRVPFAKGKAEIKDAALPRRILRA